GIDKGGERVTGPDRLQSLRRKWVERSLPRAGRRGSPRWRGHRVRTVRGKTETRPARSVAHAAQEEHQALVAFEYDTSSGRAPVSGIRISRRLQPGPEFGSVLLRFCVIRR